ncbi:MAG: ATP-dependent exonuclease [Flavobacteriales bacterium]|nr:ATP-dependent exonuclease [Flavobacteriales bacterium]MBO72161.1 ATP-dependent exonuclease [Flavobacteriales bacterium]|tara:strand:+ start:104 stop:895 length:792 start_codon:yes stop_codon:yes gene_type:complete
MILILGVFAFTANKNPNLEEVDSLRKIKQSSFKKGEFLRYDVSYGFFDAAQATLKVEPSSKEINGRKTMHIVGKGKSTGTLRWFFKVDDRYETYIDEEAILPWKFVRHVREGGYKLDRNIDFNHYSNEATVFEKDTKNYAVKPNSQDLLSAFYYARTLDLQGAKVGQEFVINTFFDMEMYPLKIKFLGKEEIETKLGEFKCLKFRPMVEKGRVFKEEEDMTLWISDDENKVPIRLKADLLVGAIKMDLIEFKNLCEPLNKIDD